MTVNQISVFVENKAGKLAALTRVLREHNIDMRALSIAEVQGYGIARLIVEDVYEASTVLKNADYVFRLTPVIAVPLRDSSGGLDDVLDALEESAINIEYLYAFVSRQKHKAYAILRVEDTQKAIAALQRKGCTPVSQEELCQD